MTKSRCPYVKQLFALLSLSACFWIGPPANAQSAAPQAPQDRDTTLRELGNFDSFMDSHPEIAEQIRKDPSLVNDKTFVANHPALQTYLQQHPGVSEEIRENPNAFMHQERRFDAYETRRELTNLDQFMDSHAEIAEQLRKDPSLVNNKQYLQDHPALQEFLQQHGAAAQDLRQNPDAFMHKEERFDRREDGQNQSVDRDRDFNRDRDMNRSEMASMDQFLDGHPEIAEQVRKNPALLNDKKFVDAHPALQSYLQQHPQVRQEASANPNAFMHQEERFDRREDGRDFGRDGDFNRDRDMNRGEMASMDQFLDSHPEVAEQVRKNPALLNDKKFIDVHPALQSYLQQHPRVRQEASENPNAFMHQEQRFDHQEGFGQTGQRFDHDTQRGELSSFGQFLGGHPNIAQQISKDPSLVNNAEYMQNHPELKTYLQAHPGVQEELKENPQAFMQSAQQQGAKPMPKGSALAHPEQKQY